MPQLHVIGISHRTAPFQFRERAVLSPNVQENIVADFKKNKSTSFAILQTCNRSEIIFFSKTPANIQQLFIQHCKITKEEFEKYGFLKSEKEAYKHIFSVTAGLDSQILGDYQVVKQVKDAFKQAQKNGTSNANLDRLYQFLLKSAKRIKNETGVSTGRSSIGGVCVDMWIKNMHPLKNKKILLLGLGEVGQSLVEQLNQRGYSKQTTIANRDFDLAQSVAQKNNMQWCKLNEILFNITNFDIIAVATRSQLPIVLKKHFNGVNKNILLCDLSIPRNVAAECQQINQLKIITIEHIKDTQIDNLAERKAALPKAMQIIDEEIAAFNKWLHHRQYMPYVAYLNKQVETKRQQKVKNMLPPLTENEKKELIALTQTNAEKAVSAYIDLLRHVPHNEDSLPPFELEKIDFFKL